MCGGGIEGVSMVAWTLRKCEFRGRPWGSSVEGVLRWTVGAVGLGDRLAAGGALG